MDMQPLRRVFAGAMTLPPARQAARVRCHQIQITGARSEQTNAAAGRRCYRAWARLCVQLMPMRCAFMPADPSSTACCNRPPGCNVFSGCPARCLCLKGSSCSADSVCLPFSGLRLVVAVEQTWSAAAALKLLAPPPLQAIAVMIGQPGSRSCPAAAALTALAEQSPIKGCPWCIQRGCRFQRCRCH